MNPIQTPEKNFPANDLRLIDYHYGMALKQLLFNAYQARMQQRDAETILLAENLIQNAKAYDIQQTLALISQPFAADIPRDPACPVSYTDPSVTGQPWADDAQCPLTWGESWNKGRRATNTHNAYALNKDGLPVNPYLNYGVNGRGTIGRFGPNHAVDDGIVSVRLNQNGQPALHALGIIRHDDGKAALCGGFAEFRTPLRYSKDDVVSTQTQEFFEELISGSVALLPEYAEHVADELAEAIRNREIAQNGSMNETQKKNLENQIITHHKLQQVKERDPLFLENVQSLFETVHECYAGPVLNSTRNTNNAWMETKMSWFELNEDIWNDVKGADTFAYDFKAGDDAQDVLWHEITPELVTQASGSHGAFFSYLLSAYLLTKKQTDPDAAAALKHQAETLNIFYTQQNAAPRPAMT